MILVIAEQREGKLNRASWEAIAAAQAAGGPVTIALPGSCVDSVAAERNRLTISSKLLALARNFTTLRAGGSR